MPKIIEPLEIKTPRNAFLVTSVSRNYPGDKPFLSPIARNHSPHEIQAHRFMALSKRRSMINLCHDQILNQTY